MSSNQQTTPQPPNTQEPIVEFEYLRSFEAGNARLDRFRREADSYRAAREARQRRRAAKRGVPYFRG